MQGTAPASTDAITVRDFLAWIGVLLVAEIDDSGRLRSLAAGGTVALVVAAAAVALWRFRRTGSALVVDARGAVHLDPIAVVAPALVLIAAALFAGLMFGIGAAAVERLAARTRGLRLVLASRQVARRGVLYGVVVLLIAIAVGGTTMAATYAPT